MFFLFHYLFIQHIFTVYLLHTFCFIKLASNLMTDTLLGKGILDNALVNDNMISVVQELFL